MSTLVCMCMQIILLTPFHYAQPATPSLLLLEYVVAGVIELAFIWPYHSASLPVFESGAFIRR